MTPVLDTLEFYTKSRKGAGFGPFRVSWSRGVHVETRPLTIFVGPQASGKSLLMQMLFFFQAFPFLFARFTSEEEIEPALAVQALLDRLRRGEVRDRTRGFYNFVRRSLHFQYRRRGHALYPGYTEAEIHVYETRSRPEISDSLKAYIQAQTGKVAWREELLRPEPAIFIPSERSFYSRFLNVEPSVLQLPSLPLTMRWFSFVLERARGEVQNWPEGKPDTPEGKWVHERARAMLQGEAYMPAAGPKVWKWRTADGTVHDLEMASSGQMEAWPITVIATLLFSWRRDGIVPGEPYAFSLYIEEPETHLHPLAQVEMTKIIAYLVNKGFAVTVTTHSPLLLFLLNSFIEASDARLKEIRDRSLPDLEVRLQPQKVIVYEVKNGSIERIIDEEGWIDEDRLRQAEWAADRYLYQVRERLETLLEGAPS